jgi:decaprenylphospho-beta-D-erythro-pentofuranosid-2-ulose 2-reductase
MTSKTRAARGVIILGASSAIAEALARRFAAKGARLGLVARDPAKLEALAADLKVRGAQAIAVRSWDLAQAPPSGALEDLAREMGGADTVVIAYGLLGEQAQAEVDLEAAHRLLEVNFTSAVLWALEARRVLAASCATAGLIVGLGSVAGDRGRKSNFVYGAAKGGLALALQGMAHRAALAGGPRAMVVKLGFVDTPMTAGFKKGGPLWSSPDQAATAIAKAMERPTAIAYAPWFWRWIALVIRCLPQVLFDKADL